MSLQWGITVPGRNKLGVKHEVRLLVDDVEGDIIMVAKREHPMGALDVVHIPLTDNQAGDLAHALEEARTHSQRYQQ